MAGNVARNFGVLVIMNEVVQDTPHKQAVTGLLRLYEGWVLAKREVKRRTKKRRSILHEIVTRC